MAQPTDHQGSWKMLVKFSFSLHCTMGSIKKRSPRSCLLPSHDSYYCEISRDVLNNAVGAAHKSLHAVCTLTRTSSSSTISKWSIYSIIFGMFYLNMSMDWDNQNGNILSLLSQCFHIIYM